MLRPDQTSAAAVVRRKVDPADRYGLDRYADAISDALVTHERRVTAGRVTAERAVGTLNVAAFTAALSGVCWDDMTTLADPDGAAVAGTIFDATRGRWSVTTPAVFGYRPTVVGWAYQTDHSAADVCELVARDLGAGHDFTTAGGESFARSGPVDRLLESARRLRARAPLFTVPINMPSHLR